MNSGLITGAEIGLWWLHQDIAASLPCRYCSKNISEYMPSQICSCLFSRSCASCSTDTAVFPK